MARETEENIQEVFKDIDSVTAALIDGILEESGIDTVLHHWTAANISKTPSPILFSNICVLEDADIEEAKKIIREYQNAAPGDLPDWECPKCGSGVGAYFTQCWSCQTPRKNFE